MKSLFTGIALLLIGSTGLFAQTTKWALDRTHSNLGFSVSHMVVSETKGRFDDFSITTVSDKEDFSDAKIDITIKVETVNTDDKKRDGHLRSPDFFDVAKFPTMTFKSREMKKIGEKKYKLIGDFTMKGVTKQIELDVKFGGLLSNKGKTVAGFKVSGTINRQDYGVKWNSVLDTGGSVVGDEVEFVANLELNKQ